MNFDLWVSQERADQEERLRRFHPIDTLFVANCGCVYHAEDGIECQHDLALRLAAEGKA